jgi:hypothetical protein
MSEGFKMGLVLFFFLLSPSLRADVTRAQIMDWLQGVSGEYKNWSGQYHFIDQGTFRQKSGSCEKFSISTGMPPGQGENVIFNDLLKNENIYMGFGYYVKDSGAKSITDDKLILVKEFFQRPSVDLLYGGEVPLKRDTTMMTLKKGSNGMLTEITVVEVYMPESLPLNSRGAQIYIKCSASPSGQVGH